MKIEFAPLNTPLARRLQTVAVLQWILTFISIVLVSIGIMVLLVVYNYWYIYIPYLIWLYFDWQTPEQGGRRCNWVKSWTVWRHFNNYFPLHLIKTQDLDPGQNYIFGFHPHGVFAIGAFGNFCLNYSDFKKLFPGFTPYVHSLLCLFMLPFGREYLMSLGVVPVSKKSISHVMSKEGGGNISIIVPGGAREALDAHPGKYTLHMHKRKGFIRLALIHGANLVPVFSFGENELFKQINNPEGSWLRIAQEKIKQSTAVTLPLIYARGIFQYNFGLVPYRKPTYTIVGRPIPVRRTPHPTQEQVDQLHQTYMEELKKLFDEHKGKYGIPEHKTLVFK